MRILYLYTELMGYNLPVLRQLVERYGASIDVIHWNRNKLTPYKPDAIPGVTFHERSALTPAEMVEFALKLSPQVVYITAWMDRGYFPVARALKARGVPVVTGLDSQWTGSLRQRLGAQLVRWVYKPRYFSHVWVPGPLQFEYAARIGFHKDEVICNLLTGDSALFSRAARARASLAPGGYPHAFLFVGRFAQDKGIDILVNAYDIYRQRYGGSWGLTCVGNGPMQSLLDNHPGVVVEPFLSQPKLVELALRAGAFVLPSRYEPWGVVVHEFAAAGMPLILSGRVGARLQFLIDGYNGYTIPGDTAEGLAATMHRLSTLDDARLIDMGAASARLAQAITPELAAASLMSVVGSGVTEVGNG